MLDFVVHYVYYVIWHFIAYIKMNSHWMVGFKHLFVAASFADADFPGGLSMALKGTRLMPECPSPQPH